MDTCRTNRECTFDKIIGFEGAYKLLKTEGQAALERELSRRGLGNTAKSIALTAQRLDDSIQRRKSTGFDVNSSGPASYQQDDPASAIDESLFIEDDAERLTAKANKLGVSEQVHTRLLMTLTTQTLERVYNRALVTGSKAMPDAEHQALLVYQTAPLIPDEVMSALAKELGDSLFYHVLEDLRLSLVFGPAMQPKAYTPPQRIKSHHPTFGVPYDR